jgi:hypothetical protein
MKKRHLSIGFAFGLCMSGMAANLVWTPGSTGNWDLITDNWVLQGTTASALFASGDNVTFDQNGYAQQTVTLSGLLSPATVVVDSPFDYTFAGTTSAKLTNVSSLIKRGDSRLIVDSNDVITNLVTIEQGTIQLGNATDRGTLGSGYPGGTAAVVNNGTLAFNRTVSLAFSNNISGSGRLEVLPSATAAWNLYGANTMNNYAISHNGNSALYFGTPGSLGTPASITADATQDKNVRIQMGGGVNLPASCPITGTLAYAGGSSTRFVLMGVAGTNSVSGPITLAGDSWGDYRPISGFYAQNEGSELDVYSSVSESDPAGNPFRGVFWLRGTGAAGRMRGVINLPAAQLVKTDLSTWTLYASGNQAFETLVSVGRLAMAAANALPVAPITVVSELDLAGFDQKSGPLWGPGTITNSSTSRDVLLTLSNGGGFSGTILDSGTGKIGIKLLNPGAPLTQQLTGNCGYRGPTILDTATAIALGNSGLPNSTPIEMGDGSSIDVSSLKADKNFTLGAAQTLKANGTVHISGNLIIQGTISLKVSKSGGTVSAGNLKIDSGYAVTYGGTLGLELSGEPLGGSDEIKLFTANSYSGSFTIVPATPGPGRTWNTSTLATDGTLRITSTLPTTPTTLTVALTSGGTQLQLGWPANYKGWALQGQTNAPKAGITANWHYVPGSDQVNTITIPIDPANGSVFFRLALP